MNLVSLGSSIYRRLNDRFGISRNAGFVAASAAGQGSCHPIALVALSATPDLADERDGRVMRATRRLKQLFALVAAGAWASE